MSTRNKSKSEQAYDDNPIFEEGGHRELVPTGAAPLALIRDYAPMRARYQLTQSMSKQGDVVGAFFNQFTGESAATLDVIPLYIQPLRLKRPDRYGQPVQCLSQNGTRSVSVFNDGVTKPLYPDAVCRDCPLYSDDRS